MSLTRNTTSDGTGAYLITNLPVGQYQHRVEAAGFQSYEQIGITLVVDRNARLDVSLTVRAASQTVQVTGESSGVQADEPGPLPYQQAGNSVTVTVPSVLDYKYLAFDCT